MLASGYATLHDISNGRMADGDRPGRLGPPLHRAAARQGRRVRAAPADDQGLHERPRGRVEREGAAAQVGPARAPRDPDVGRGLRAEGARGRGPYGRRRRHPARRPGDHRVDHGHRAEGRRGGGARSFTASVHRQRAELHRRRHATRSRPGALVPGDGLEPRHGSRRALWLRLRDPPRAHRVRARPEVLRLRRPLPRGRKARRVRHGRDLRPLLRPRKPGAGDRQAPRSSRRSGSTSSTSTS